MKMVENVIKMARTKDEGEFEEGRMPISKKDKFWWEKSRKKWAVDYDLDLPLRFPLAS